MRATGTHCNHRRTAARAAGRRCRCVVVGVAGGLLGLVGCADEASAPGAPGAVAERSAAVVYGADDRRDVPDHPDARLRRLATRSVVALFSARDLVEDAEGRVRVPAVTLAEAAGVCLDETFASQPIGPGCSGTLVGPDLVLTAGHCVADTPCAAMRLVFGWHTVAGGTLNPLTTADVYRCARYEVSRLDEAGRDYALVRLDRAVDAAREPAPIRQSNRRLAAGTAVTLIGYPSGLPAKIDDGGQVTASRVADAFGFFATMDAFGGNSGSGVFDAAGRVVGVLVSGNEDYAFDPADRCLRVVQLSPDVTEAERAVYPFSARAELCDRQPGDPLCAVPAGPWCMPCDGDQDACAPDFVCGLGGTCVAPCQGAYDCRADHLCRGGLCVPRAGSDCAVVLPDAAVPPDFGVADAEPADLGEPPDLALADAEPPDTATADAEPRDARLPRDRGPGWELGPETDAWAPRRNPPTPTPAGDAARPPPNLDPGLPVSGADAPAWAPRDRPDCSQRPGDGAPDSGTAALLGLVGWALGRRRRTH